MARLSILRLSMLAIILAVVCFHTSFADSKKPKLYCSERKDKGKKDTISCHTCMGFNSENCEGGTVCCVGSCFKLVDQEHDIIAKGCEKKSQEDDSMRTRATNALLPMHNKEPLKGKMYYCKGKDFCNGGSSVIASVIVLLIALGVLKAAI